MRANVCGQEVFFSKKWEREKKKEEDAQIGRKRDIIMELNLYASNNKKSKICECNKNQKKICMEALIGNAHSRPYAFKVI